MHTTFNLLSNRYYFMKRKIKKLRIDGTSRLIKFDGCGKSNT